MQGNKTYFFHILKQTIGPQNLCYLLMNVVKFSSNSNLVLSNLITTVQKIKDYASNNTDYLVLNQRLGINAI